MAWELPFPSRVIRHCGTQGCQTSSSTRWSYIWHVSVLSHHSVTYMISNYILKVRQRQQRKSNLYFTGHATFATWHRVAIFLHIPTFYPPHFGRKFCVKISPFTNTSIGWILLPKLWYKMEELNGVMLTTNNVVLCIKYHNVITQATSISLPFIFQYLFHFTFPLIVF